MTTAAQMDRTVASGVSGLKAHMKSMMDNIKAVNSKADEYIAENEQAKKAHARAYHKHMTLRDKIQDTEEKIRKAEEKVKETQKRLLEKEQLLIEMKSFNRQLKDVTPEEGLVDELEARLRKYKSIYAENFKRYQNARQLRVTLEQNLEQRENRRHDLTRKVESLQTEIEYSQTEERRKTEACKAAIDGAFSSERNCLDLERALEYVMDRKEKAMKRITQIEAEITKTDNSIDTFNYERRRIEATLKELLTSVRKEQERK